MTQGAVAIRPRAGSRTRAESWLQRHWWTGLFWSLLLLLLFLVGLPLLGLLAGSLSVSGTPSRFAFTLAHFTKVLGDTRTYELLVTSVVFSAASVVMATVIGAPLAWLVERTDLPKKNVIRAVIFAQVAIPPVLLAMSWVLLLSPKIGLLNALVEPLLGPAAFNVYSMPGMIIVQGLSLVPLIFIMLSPALRNLDASYEEAALAAGTPLRTVLRRVSFPIIRPALLAVVLYAFVLGLLAFDIPATVGIPGNIFVFSSEIYFYIHRYAVPLYGPASALSMVTLVIVLGLGLFYLRATGGVRRFATMTGKFRPHALRLGPRGKAIAFTWLGVYLAAGLVLPIAVMAWTSFLPYFTRLGPESAALLTLQNYQDVFSTGNGPLALRNTVQNSIVAATVGTMLAAVIAWVVMKSPVRQRRLLDVLALAPLVIPGVVLGLSLQYVYLALAFLPVYGTIWILTISHVTASLPFGTRNTNSAMAQVHPELEEASLASGRSYFNAFRTITLPLIAPALVFIWLWTLVHSVRDLSTSVMLYSPRNPVLANVLWQLWDYGNLTTGAAVGTLMLVVLFAIALLALRILGRSRSGAGLL